MWCHHIHQVYTPHHTYDAAEADSIAGRRKSSTLVETIPSAAFCLDLHSAGCQTTLLSHHAQSWVCRRVWHKSHTLVSVLILSRYRLEICTIEAATTGVLVWICSTWPLSISLHCRRDQRLSVAQERAILDEGSDASGGGFHSSPE